MLSDSTRAEPALGGRRQPGRPGRRFVLLTRPTAPTGRRRCGAGLERAADAAAGNRIYCNNDLASDADVVSIDAAGAAGGKRAHVLGRLAVGRGSDGEAWHTGGTMNVTAASTVAASRPAASSPGGDQAADESCVRLL